MYSELEGPMAEFEERLPRDPESFSLPSQETTKSPARRTREKRRILTAFSRFFPGGKSGYGE